MNTLIQQARVLAVPKLSLRLREFVLRTRQISRSLHASIRDHVQVMSMVL